MFLRRTILLLFGLLLLAACGGSKPADTTAPTVVSVYPNDGFHGFKHGDAITISFSEPVDPISVMNAYRSEDEGLKPDQVTFAFAEGGKKVLIQPLRSLLYSPTDDYLYYRFELGRQVTDRAGNPLAEPLRVTFSTMRTLSTDLPSEPSRDGSASPAAAVSDQALLSVGDGATNAGIRGFFSFTFPEDADGVLAAELRFFVHHISGTPFADLGRLNLEPLTLGEALDATDYYTSALSTPITDAGTGWTDGSYHAYGVSDWVVAAWNEGRRRLEVRLRFDAETDNDGSADALFLVAQDAEEVPDTIGPEYLPRLRLTYYGP
jgi:hypothetical protein